MQNFKRFLGQGKFFVLGAIATAIALAFSPKVQAAGEAGAPGRALSSITILFIVMGVVVSVLYIKAMLTILNEAADSYDEAETESDGSYYAAPAWGAALAGVVAALVIFFYGLNPSFLYLGPILAMISPMAILYCMVQDIESFKATQADRQKSVAEELTGLRS